MKLTITDEQTLDALVSQHAESRSPVQTMIVQAACNARASSDRDKIRASLSRLKATGFVARTTSDRWIPTKSGIARATGVPEADDKGDDSAESCSENTDSQHVEQGFTQYGDIKANRFEVRYVCDGCGETVDAFRKHDCSGIYSCDAGEYPAGEQASEYVVKEGEGLENARRASNQRESLFRPEDIVASSWFKHVVGGVGGHSAHNILERAGAHMRNRAATYDKPEGERSMGATVGAFQEITGLELTEEQGWLFMTLLKAVRSQQGGYRADSYEDGAAYFALAGEAAGRDRQ